MRDRAKDLGSRALALLVLLVAAYVLFKVVIGVVSAIAWTIVGILALVGVVWALSRLL